MKNGKTVVAIALALGLAATSLGVRAQEEGGTGVGTPHEEEGTTGEHKAHHRTRGAHAHKGMKKGMRSKGEGSTTGVAGGVMPTEPHHGHESGGVVTPTEPHHGHESGGVVAPTEPPHHGHAGSMPEGGHEEMEEGSH